MRFWIFQKKNRTQYLGYAQQHYNMEMCFERDIIKKKKNPSPFRMFIHIIIKLSHFIVTLKHVEFFEHVFNAKTFLFKIVTINCKNMVLSFFYHLLKIILF